MSLFPDVASPEFTEVGELGWMFSGCGVVSGWQWLYRRKCDVKLIEAWGGVRGVLKVCSHETCMKPTPTQLTLKHFFLLILIE